MSRFLKIIHIIFIDTITEWAYTYIVNDCPQTSDKTRTDLGNEIFDHPDVVGASPVGAARATPLAPFNRLCKYKMRRVTDKFCDLVRLILNV